MWRVLVSLGEHMQFLTRDQFQVHLQRILDSPDSAVDVCERFIWSIRCFRARHRSQ